MVWQITPQKMAKYNFDFGGLMLIFLFNMKKAETIRGKATRSRNQITCRNVTLCIAPLIEQIIMSEIQIIVMIPLKTASLPFFKSLLFCCISKKQITDPIVNNTPTI